MSGPLTGITVVELAGLGALPFGTLKLADMGADVIRVDRAAEVPATAPDPPRPFSEWDRGRRSIGVDLKHPDGVEVVLRLAEHADALVESFRPGVAERLGVGPGPTMARNPQARVRAADRVGPGRTAGAERRALAQLRVDHRRDRLGGRAARAADADAPGARRLRRRWAAPRVRRGVRAARGAAVGEGAGRRRGDGRRRGVDLLGLLRHGAVGHAHRGHRHQPLRRRRALLLGVRDRRREVRERWRRSNRTSTRSCSSSSASTPTDCRTSTTGRSGRR